MCVINTDKLHQILSSLWKNDNSKGKSFYNQALQDVQTAIDLCEERMSGDIGKAGKEWLMPQLDKSYANYGETKIFWDINKTEVIDAVFDMAVWLAENGYLWKNGEFRNIKENNPMVDALVQAISNQ